MFQVLNYLVLLFLPSLAFCLPATELPQQPIQISADSTFFNYKSGQNTYEGSVKLIQGTAILIADKVTTKNNAQHKLQEAIALGTTHLAEYTSITKPTDPPFVAKAKVIKFYPITSTIILEGDVLVKQGENTFQGPIIIYNTKDQTIAAPASKVGRATIVIESQATKPT